MSYPSVNLLKRSERRHQGAVNRRFILICAVVAPILMIAVLSSIKLIQYSSVKSSLAKSQEQWKYVEPRLILFKDENRGLVINRDALQLFSGWEKSKASFVDLLEDVQATVPEQIQLTRLSVRSEKPPALYTDAEKMHLAFGLVIEGQARGALAENYVINLRKDLLACERVSSTFDSINLSSMRKKEATDGVALREFKLEGATDAEEGL